MAADIFESYGVTIVAAMILGLASFGHKGVIFPLLIQALGVCCSIISTYSVRAGDKKGSVAEAMGSVNRGFIIGATLSIIWVCHPRIFSISVWTRRIWRAIRRLRWVIRWVRMVCGMSTGLPFLFNFGIAGLDMRPAWTCLIGIVLAVTLNKCTEYFTGTEYQPVKSLVKSCETGHATNIISRFRRRI